MSLRLRLDPVACDAFGYCAELVPELVQLDEWGYPIVRPDPVPAHLVDLARRAVADCPRRALALVEGDAGPSRPRPSRVRLTTTRR